MSLKTAGSSIETWCPECGERHTFHCADAAPESPLVRARAWFVDHLYQLHSIVTVVDREEKLI